MAATGQQSVPVQQTTLVVKTLSGQTLTVGAQDFAKLPPLKVSAKDHDGKDHAYAGVNLRDLLT